MKMKRKKEGEEREREEREGEEKLFSRSKKTQRSPVKGGKRKEKRE